MTTDEERRQCQYNQPTLCFPRQIHGKKRAHFPSKVINNFRNTNCAEPAQPRVNLRGGGEGWSKQTRE